MPFLVTLFSGLFTGLANFVGNTIDFTRIAILVGKIALMLVVFGIMISFMSDFGNMITSALATAFGDVNTIGSLNIGYVAGAIGADVFINNLLNSLYIAIAFYGSSMLSIIGFKYVVKMFGLAGRV